MGTLKVFVALATLTFCHGDGSLTATTSSKPRAGLYAATLHTKPNSTSGFVGQTASFYCGVGGTQSVFESLRYTKTFPEQTSISVDNQTTNAAKYNITDRYLLTILNLTISDEGRYQCTLSGTPVKEGQASLTILARPWKVDLYWAWADGSKRSYAPLNKEANLTCVAYGIRPAATMRWFRGNTNIDSSAITSNNTANSTGYTDSETYQRLTLNNAARGTVYKCIVDLPYYLNIQTKTITVKFSGASSVGLSVTMATALFFITQLYSTFDA